jgi:hypothetical protein
MCRVGHALPGSVTLAQDEGKQDEADATDRADDRANDDGGIRAAVPGADSWKL